MKKEIKKYKYNRAKKRTKNVHKQNFESSNFNLINNNCFQLIQIITIDARIINESYQAGNQDSILLKNNELLCY